MYSEGKIIVLYISVVVTLRVPFCTPPIHFPSAGEKYMRVVPGAFSQLYIYLVFELSPEWLYMYIATFTDQLRLNARAWRYTLSAERKRGTENVP